MASIPLPAFLDPALEYIRNVIPAPLFSLLLSFLSHTLALLTAFSAVVFSLLSTKPWEWDAQTVIPPLVSLLAAYLALVSLYRTTTWAIRTSLWFIKWAVILAVLVSSAGWLMGTTRGLVVPGINGLMSGLGGLVLEVINGQGQSPPGSYKSQNRPKGSQRSKPKPWDSFERHREWQEQRRPHDADRQSDVQRYIADVVGAAGRVVRESGWWEVAKNVVEGAGTQEAGDLKNRARTGKTTSKSSRPR